MTVPAIKLQDTASPSNDFVLRPGSHQTITFTLNDPPGTLTTDVLTAATGVATITNRRTGQAVLVNKVVASFDNVAKTASIALTPTETQGWEPGLYRGDLLVTLATTEVRAFQHYEFEVDAAFSR